MFLYARIPERVQYLMPKAPSCEYVCACVCSNSSLKSLSQLKTKSTWDHHGIGEKIYSNDSGQLFFILILSAPGGRGLLAWILPQKLARQCRALKIEKLKAPLFRGPEGAGATNDWCITIAALWSILKQIGIIIYYCH